MIDVANADFVLSTTRSVRKRLDLDRPVPLSLIEECIEVALQAPTGGNRQGWRFLVVTDEDKRRALAERYADAWTQYRSSAAFDYEPDDPRQLRLEAVLDSAQYLADHLHEVPVHVIPCIHGRTEGLPLVWTATILGSVLPATWSFMLAARARGLGSSWTTLHLMYEREVAAALGIPPDVTQCALVPVAYLVGEHLHPAPRLPARTVTYLDQWEQPFRGSE
jgi:nitroreductase